MTKDLRHYQKPETGQNSANKAEAGPDSPKQAEEVPGLTKQAQESPGLDANYEYWDSYKSFDDVRRIYVKTKYHRYQSAFDSCDAQGGIQMSFSFGALIFGWLWFFYRKMYKEGLLILGAGILLNIIFHIWGLEKNFAIAGGISLLFYIATGIYGKGLYWMAANSQIARAMDLSPSNPRGALHWLSENGGVHTWMLIVGGILGGFFLLLVAIAIAVPA